MIFGVRHGERADKLSKKNAEFKAIEISFDPHLSKRGIQQAEETGLFIQNKINEYAAQLSPNKEPNQITAIVITSPFLRTIMTAYAISKNLNKVHENTIFLQEDICEYLSIHEYKNFPLDSTLYKTKSHDITKYVDNTKISLKWNFYQPTKRPRYPETPYKADDRIANGIKLMKAHYFTSFDPAQYVVIYITHQYTLQSSMLSFGTSIVADQCDYCAILQVVYPHAVTKKEFDQQQILIKGTNTHITHLLSN